MPDANIGDFLGWFTVARKLVNAPKVPHPHEAKALLESRMHWSMLGDSLPRRRWRRWRDEVARVVKALRAASELTDLRRTVQKWSAHCRNEYWEQAGQTKVGKAQGGEALTLAASDYFQALQWKVEGNVIACNEYLCSARVKLEAAKSEASEGVVHEIADAMTAMIYHHMRHPLYCEKAAEIIAALGDHWQSFKRFLNVTCGFKASATAGDGTIGLGDFSPHPKDVQLEEMIFNES